MKEGTENIRVPRANSAGKSICAIDERVLKVLKLLEKDPSIRITSLASSVCLSSSRLAHLFSRETGYSLFSFVLIKRLSHAARMLESRTVSVKSVANVLGYAHVSNFSRAFRTRFGVSPARYKVCFRELSVGPSIPVVTNEISRVDP